MVSVWFQAPFTFEAQSVQAGAVTPFNSKPRLQKNRVISSNLSHLGKPLGTLHIVGPNKNTDLSNSQAIHSEAQRREARLNKRLEVASKNLNAHREYCMNRLLAEIDDLIESRTTSATPLESSKHADSSADMRTKNSSVRIMIEQLNSKYKNLEQ